MSFQSHYIYSGWLKLHENLKTVTDLQLHYQLVSKKVKDDIVSGDMKATFLYHVFKKKKRKSHSSPTQEQMLELPTIKQPTPTGELGAMWKKCIPAYREVFKIGGKTSIDICSSHECFNETGIAEEEQRGFFIKGIQMLEISMPSGPKHWSQRETHDFTSFSLFMFFSFAETFTLRFLWLAQHIVYC